MKVVCWGFSVVDAHVCVDVTISINKQGRTAIHPMVSLAVVYLLCICEVYSKLTPFYHSVDRCFVIFQNGNHRNYYAILWFLTEVTKCNADTG